MDLLTAKAIDAIKAILESQTTLELDENTEAYSGEIYLDHEDALSLEQIKEITDSQNPRDTYYEIVDSNDYEDYEYDELLDMIEKNWNEEEKPIPQVNPRRVCQYYNSYERFNLLCGNEPRGISGLPRKPERYNFIRKDELRAV